MKRHLTERELIEYEFGLAAEGQAADAAEHLQGCGRCREELAGLKRRFGSLELLREEPQVSEELVERALRQAAVPVAAKGVLWRVPAVIGAVAAVFLMGSVLFVSLSQRREKVPPVAMDLEERPGEAATSKGLRRLRLSGWG